MPLSATPEDEAAAVAGQPRVQRGADARACLAHALALADAALPSAGALVPGLVLQVATTALELFEEGVPQVRVVCCMDEGGGCGAIH